MPLLFKVEEIRPNSEYPIILNIYAIVEILRGNRFSSYNVNK